MKTTACASVTVALLAGGALLLTPAGRPPAAQIGALKAGGARDGALALSLAYDGKLLVKVLELTIEQHATRTGHSAAARMMSSGIVRLFFHIDTRASVEGPIEGGEVEPGVFDYGHVGSKRGRTVRVVWRPGDVAVQIDPPFKDMGDPPASPAQKLAAADPLTELMRITLARSRAELCRGSDLFFDGKQLYRLDYSNPRPTHPTDRETRLGLVNLFRCDARFHEMAGFGKKPPDKRDQGLKTPVNADFAQAGEGGPWVVSSVRSQTPLGWAVIELQSMEVAGKVPTS